MRKWARSLFPGSRYDIRTNNPAESINSALRSPRQFPVIPLLDSIREMMTRWFYERRMLSSKHIDPLTDKVEKKIDRRIVKARGFQVQKVDNFRSLVKGDIYDCHVDLETRTCTCGKFDLGKIPCRHAIPAIYSRGMEVYKHYLGTYIFQHFAAFRHWSVFFLTQVWKYTDLLMASIALQRGELPTRNPLIPYQFQRLNEMSQMRLNLRRSYHQSQERVLVDQ